MCSPVKSVTQCVRVVVQGERRPGFVGLPLPGVEVKVVPPEDSSSSSGGAGSSASPDASTFGESYGRAAAVQHALVCAAFNLNEME